MNSKEIKILIADDHDLIRQGLKRVIDLEEDLAVVGEANNGEEVFKKLKLYNPNILLLDRNMPLVNGIEVLRKIKEQGMMVKVIMITVENDDKTIHDAINIGVDGYLLKESSAGEIVEAIHRVHKGGKYIDKSLVSLLFTDIKESNKKNNSLLDDLSQREMEVLINISKGYSNKEIGELLFLSEKTIKNYATKIFRKINAKDRVHATIFAMQNQVEEYYKFKFRD